MPLRAITTDYACCRNDEEGQRNGADEYSLNSAFLVPYNIHISNLESKYAPSNEATQVTLPVRMKQSRSPAYNSKTIMLPFHACTYLSMVSK